MSKLNYSFNGYNNQLDIPMKREGGTDYPYQFNNSNYQQLLNEQDSTTSDQTMVAANAYHGQSVPQNNYSNAYTPYSDSYYQPANGEVATAPTTNCYQQENAGQENKNPQEYSWYYQNNQMS